MIAYATQADLFPLRMTQKELRQLTDDTNTGEIKADIVSAALEEASGKVDCYCRSRYVIPLRPSDTTKSLTLDVAAWLLFSRSHNVKIPEAIVMRYHDAISFLKDISDGKAQLDSASVGRED